ncbi:MAG: radical SAM protein [Planctomycetaceae bacterium]|nr:radical SAM protein [Planctomycetaceae bacterium]
MITKLKIFADYHCNLSCSYCVQNVSRRTGPLALPILDPAPDAGPSLESMSAFLKQFKEAVEKPSIYLSGGEPLASKPWFRMARLLHDLDLPYKTISNGTLLEQKIDDLLKVRPSWIAFTFNGVGERHDRVVGVSGAYAAMSKALQKNVPRLQEAGIRVEATYVMTEQSYRHLADDFRVLSEIPFQQVTLQHLSYLEPEICEEHREVYHELLGTSSPFLFVEETPVPQFDLSTLYEQIQQVASEPWPFDVAVYPPLIELDELTDYYAPDPQYYRERKCERFDEEIWILPDGRITSCFQETFGNVATHSYHEVLDSHRRNTWIETLHNLDEPLPGCRRCHRIHTFPRQGPGESL